MADYYDPRVGLGSAYKYYKSQDKYTYKQIKEMLDKKEAFQLNKQGTKTSFFVPNSWKRNVFISSRSDVSR